MPKLPEGKSSSILEVAEKQSYNRGEIKISKAPRHRIVLGHHFKLVAILTAVCVMLGLVFVAGKPFLNKAKVEETPAPKSELENFKAPNEAYLKYPNLEYQISLTVDRVDGEQKLIYGTNLFADGKQYVVRVQEATQIVVSRAPNEPVLFSTESANFKNFEQITQSRRVSVIATEDPQTEQYLNAASVVIQ